MSGEQYDANEPPPWVGSAPASASRRPNNQGRRSSGGGRGSYQQRSYQPRSQESDRGEYIEVKERIQEFYARFPEGRLTSEIWHAPEGSREDAITSQLIAITEQEYTAWEGSGDNRTKTTKRRPSAAGLVIVKAYAYRTPDDPLPGVGHSWMLMPGTTPYTFASELENAETSAWGRAIAACGIAISKGIASGSEIRKASGAEPEPTGEQPAEQPAEAAQEPQPAKARPSRSRKGNPEAQDEPGEAGAVPGDPVASGGAPETAEAESAVETPTESDPPAEDGQIPEPVLLSVPRFLELVKETFVHSSVVNRVRSAIYPDSSRMADLSDAERAILWDAIQDDLRLAAQEAKEGE